jgi:hypothetical protein
MADRAHLPIAKQAAALNISRGSVYLLAPAGVGLRPRADAADRRAASGVPLCGQPMRTGGWLK